MKTLILSLYLLLFSLQAQAFESDKFKHFGATTLISSSVYSYSRNQGLNKWESAFLGIVSANLVGVIKEMNDSEFDNRDIQANVLGSVFGVGLAWGFE